MSEAEPPKPEFPPSTPPLPAASSAPRLHWTFVSVALFSIGLVIAVPSGLCTLVLGVPTIFIQPGDLPMVLLIGGIPFLVGCMLVVAGRNTRRRDD
jgi:hypothetical protein